MQIKVLENSAATSTESLVHKVSVYGLQLETDFDKYEPVPLAGTQGCMFGEPITKLKSL